VDCIAVLLVPSLMKENVGWIKFRELLSGVAQTLVKLKHSVVLTECLEFVRRSHSVLRSVLDVRDLISRIFVILVSTYCL
jgi:hypothetical protein